MTRLLLWLITLLFVGHISIAQIQTSKFAYQKFSADTVKHTIDEITKELSLKHPGFYRYNSRDNFKKYIDSIKYTINDSLTELRAYLKLKAIFTKIHCLHTGISLPQEYTDYLNQQPNLFPLQLYFINNKTYVVKNHSDIKSILPGDEIISINGKSIDKIIAELLPLIPSDGYNLTMKYEALYYQFPSWYRSIDLTETFIVTVKQNNIETTYQVRAAKFNDIAEDGFLKEPVKFKQLEFKIANNIGFLTIHSFAKTKIKSGNQNFNEFIDQTFAELKNKNIENLVVDLRDNTGGTDPYAVYFTKYFFDKPFNFGEHTIVTDAIAKEIKGVQRLFYKKPIYKDSVWLWQDGKVKDLNTFATVKNAKNNYKGKTYILINGFCISSCANVTAVLSYNNKAIFIGQETGGGYQGNTSGMLPKGIIEPYKFTMTVPLQSYYLAVDSTKNIGRGTMPDYPINITIDDILKGKDKELTATIDLIHSGSK